MKIFRGCTKFSEVVPKEKKRKAEGKLSYIYPKLTMFYHVNPHLPKVSHVLPR